MMLTNLDNKISELKSQLNESRKLKEDAEKLLTEHNKKYKETLIKIKKINENAIYESKIIKKNLRKILKIPSRKEKGFKQLPRKWNSK